MTLDATAVQDHVTRVWADDIVPALRAFIRIPNVSPAYDAGWAEAGHMARATELLRQWCVDRAGGGVLADATVDVRSIAGRTPLLVVDVPPAGGGSAERTVLLYGHLDKQPPLDGWRAGLAPWEPVIQGGRLYGRGGADDGYAPFAALAALEAVRLGGGAHDRCVLLVEASEESASVDLPAHLAALADRIGQPSLVVALDSWCADWGRLWVTTSLRGLVDLTVTVEVLREGVHSGSASGLVPSSFRILRQLLDRIEDASTGQLLLPELHVEVPEHRRRQTVAAARSLEDLAGDLPLAAGVRLLADTPEERLLARTWHPALEVVGLGGAPPPETAGNVLRPATSAKLSVRLPPTADPREAAAAIVLALVDDPPYGAPVQVEPTTIEPGWSAPPEPSWLAAAIEAASLAAFGRSHGALGEGGTIPFLGMLGHRFPEAQFVVTGVLGPGANAHGPNEFLHLPTARRVTIAVAHLLDAHARSRTA